MINRIIKCRQVKIGYESVSAGMQSSYVLTELSIAVLPTAIEELGGFTTVQVSENSLVVTPLRTPV